MNLKKVFFVVLGCLSLGLGALGAVLPLLPCISIFLCLRRSALRKAQKNCTGWFVSTKLYKKNLESFVQGKGMTVMTKIRIMLTVTFLMSIGFIMMHAVPVGRIVLGIVWLFHILYFIFGIKTLKIEDI